MLNKLLGGDWLWCDMNGNGWIDVDEFEFNMMGKVKVGGWGWWVDMKGDIWCMSDVCGIYCF